jgi:hypothetical protein
MRELKRIFIVLLLPAMFFLCAKAEAQSLLNKAITVSVTEKKLSDVLDGIGINGGFNFSYNGNIIPQDSLVTLNVVDKSLSKILLQLFNGKYEFYEAKNYIIITRPLERMSLINTDLAVDNNICSVSGIVVNDLTGERLINVSVYEKNQLVAALTDEHGYFCLKLKRNNPSIIAITASKVKFRDTTIHFLQQVLINSRPDNENYSNSLNKGNKVEKTGLARIFISTRQMIQSLNIPGYFATRPFQISLTPGLSSHGVFSPQVINKASLNVFGGYNAGVNGIEVGGLFNIDKNDSKYIQLAGIFNIVGGTAKGLQLAGVHNRALDTVKGAQLALFTNNAGTELSGLQISAIHNEVHKLKGLQIGLVNVADTSTGASIGLINIIGNGFFRVTWSANDLANTNLSLKTGTHMFYSTLDIGDNLSTNNKFYYLGLGVGHDFALNKTLFISTEASYSIANTGQWDDRWERIKLLLNVQISKNISLLTGPTINHYDHNGASLTFGYENITDIPNYPNTAPSDHQVKNWVGWEAGLTFNSVFKKAKATTENSQSWYVDVAGTGGIGWNRPYGFVKGGEISVQRDLGEYLTGTISAGYTDFSVQKHYLFESLGGLTIYAQPVKIIPLKAGIRLTSGERFFVTGEIGEAFGNSMENITPISTTGGYQSTLSSFHSFMYATSAGLFFKNGLETGLKFEDYGLQSQYKQFAFRLGYRFKVK